MATLSEADLGDVLALHEAARQRGGVAAMQQEVLAAAERHLGVSSSCFFVRAGGDWIHDFDRVAFRGLPGDWVDSYLGGFATDDPLAPYVRDNPTWRFGIVIADELVSAERWVNCRLFRDLFNPVGIRHMMGVELVADGAQIGLIGLFRSEREGAFTLRDVQKVSLTSATISLALRRGLDSEESRIAQEHVGTALARMAGMAFLVLDDRLRVIYSTAGGSDPSLCHLARGGATGQKELPDGLRSLAASFRRRVVACSKDARSALEVSERLRLGEFQREIRVTMRAFETTSGTCRYVLCLCDDRHSRCDVTRLVGLGLTERQAEIVALVADGLRNVDIAERLGISVNTVQTHLRSIFAKLGVSNRVGVVSRAKEPASSSGGGSGSRFRAPFKR